MNCKHAPFPAPLGFVPTLDFVWESVDLPLWNPHCLLLLSIRIPVDNVADTVLLIELAMLVPIYPNSIEEFEGARTRANKHGAGIELETISQHQ